MRLSVPLGVLCLSSSILVARSVHADDAAPPAPDTPPATARPLLRTAGTVVFDEVLAARSSGLPLTVGWFSYRTSTSRPDTGAETSTTQLRFAPSLDVFVVDAVSVGGQATIGRLAFEGGGTRTTTITREIAPRVGYAFGITDTVTFWPRVHAAYGWIDTQVEASGTSSIGGIGPGGAALGGIPSSAQYWAVGGDASLLLSLGRHVALAAGPTLSYARQRAEGLSSGRMVTTSFDVAVAASLRLVL